MGTNEDSDSRCLPEQTDILEVSDLKMKYINRIYRKVTSKMYDYNCDVKLVVGSETFKAHREVLVDASDYFSAMFTHDMREKQDDVIQLKDVSPRGFTAMIEYFYHGYVTIDASNAEGIVEVARFFHIEWLIRISRHYLACYLSLEDYQFVLQLSEQYFLGDIQSAILSYVGCNLHLLITKPRFIRIQFELIRDLLAGDWFLSATEWDVLQSVLRWLQHDPDGREQFRVQLLQLIRYPLLELHEFEHLESDVTGYPEVEDLIAEARNYHSNPTQHCLLMSSRTAARGAIPYLVLYSGIENSSVAEYRPLINDPSADIIREELNTDFLEPAFEFAAAAVLGDCLFVAGGYNHKEWCSSARFYCYSPHRRVWAELSSMASARVSHVLCEADNLGLYAVAGINHHVDAHGFDREEYLDTVEFYGPRDNLWHDAPRLPNAMFNVGATFYKGQLFVSGGISDNPELTVPVPHLYSCRPTDDGWTILSDMPHQRHSHAMIGLHDKIFVLGGLTGNPQDTMGFVECLENEVYDLATDQWTTIVPTPISFGRIHSACVVIGGQIIVLGSRGKENFSLHVFSEESLSILEGQPCGNCVHKIVKMNASFPSRKLLELILSPI